MDATKYDEKHPWCRQCWSEYRKACRPRLNKYLREWRKKRGDIKASGEAHEPAPHSVPLGQTPAGINKSNAGLQSLAPGHAKDTIVGNRVFN